MLFRWLLIYVFALVSSINPALAALTITNLSGFNSGTIAPPPQAFPVIAGTATTFTAGTSTTTPYAINLPSSISAGDMLLMFVQYRRGGRAVSGFTEAWTQAWESDDGSTRRAYAFWRIADGSEGATTSMAVTGGTENVAAAVYRITGAQSVAVGTTVLAFNAAPDPPSLSPSWGSAKTLWFVFISTIDATKTLSAYPANYSSSQLGGSPAPANALGQRISVGAYSNQTGTEDPGAGTLSASTNNVSQTIAVRPN